MEQFIAPLSRLSLWIWRLGSHGTDCKFYPLTKRSILLVLVWPAWMQTTVLVPYWYFLNQPMVRCGPNWLPRIPSCNFHCWPTIVFKAHWGFLCACRLFYILGIFALVRKWQTCLFCNHALSILLSLTPLTVIPRWVYLNGGIFSFVIPSGKC